jgi:hypothetical protein
VGDALCCLDRGQALRLQELSVMATENQQDGMFYICLMRDIIVVMPPRPAMSF